MGRLLPGHIIVFGLGERASLSKPFQRAISFSIISLTTYMLVVVLTTPSLRPSDSVAIAITVNWWVVIGLMFGTGAQGYLSAYAVERGCRIRRGRALSGGTGISSALLSFVSFLSLIPVGCCGTWLYILSVVPSLVGASFAGLLIQRSLEIELASLLVLLLSVAYSFFSIRRRIQI